MSGRSRFFTAACVAAFSLSCPMLAVGPADGAEPGQLPPIDRTLLGGDSSGGPNTAEPKAGSVSTRTSQPWRDACVIGAVPTYIDALDPGFYDKHCQIQGIDIVGTHVTSRKAVFQAAKMIHYLVDDQKAALIRAYPDRRGMRIIVVGQGQSWDYFPEYPSGAGNQCCPAVVSAGALLGTEAPGHMADLHEVTHLVNLGAGHASDPAFQRRLEDAFNAAKAEDLWPFDHEGQFGYYGGHNWAEYLAEIMVIYQGGNPASWETENVIDTRDELRMYDPRGYRLLEDTFGVWTWTRPDGNTLAGPRAGPDVIRVTATPHHGSAPLHVRLSALASAPGGRIVSYAWDFDGDGAVDTTTTGSSVTHTYTKVGLHKPTVSVADNHGEHASNWAEVIIGSAYRVNVGGPHAATMHQSWSADSADDSQLRVGESEIREPDGWVTMDMSDPSVPRGTDSKIFKTERYAPEGSAALRWQFPVKPGKYEVRLYFSEISPGAFSTGARVFDVSIEGTTVLDSFDVFAEVGKNKGLVKTFVVAADETLNIDLARVVGNPSIKGIEILPVEEYSSPAPLGRSLPPAQQQGHG